MVTNFLQNLHVVKVLGLVKYDTIFGIFLKTMTSL